MAKYKRKQFFINKELQGKYMLSFAIPMLSILVFFGLLFYFALTHGLNGSLELLNRDVTEQVAFSLQGKSNPSAEDYKFALEGVKSTVSQFATDKGKQEAVQQLIFWILLPGFGLIMVQILLLTIFFSHKLAGPVYRLELAMNRVLDGDYSEEIHLRDGDQLRNLAELTNEVIDQSATIISDLQKATNQAECEEILKKVTLPLASVK